MLAPAIRDEMLDCWDDQRIEAGTAWRRAIDDALDRAGLAVLLVTSDFLASSFIAGKELPAILQAHEERGLGIAWVPVGPSLFEHTPLAEIQAVMDPARPLSRMARAERDAAWVGVAKKILALAERATAPVTRRARAPNR